MYQEDLKMKKVLALALGILLIPFTAFGMQTMSEADMDSVTGQSGVAISVDNIQLYTASVDELWYETTLADGTTGAAVGLVYGDQSADYLFINKIGAPSGLLGGGSGLGNVNDNEDNLRGNYDPLADGTLDQQELLDQGMRLAPSVLSIRVAQHDADYGVFGELDGDDNADVAAGEGAYIEIGLPTLEIYSASGSVDELRIYVLGEEAYANDTPVGSGDQTYSLGTVWTTDAGSTTAIMGGRIGITSLGQVPEAATSSTYQSESAE